MNLAKNLARVIHGRFFCLVRSAATTMALVAISRKNRHNKEDEERKGMTRFTPKGDFTFVDIHDEHQYYDDLEQNKEIERQEAACDVYLDFSQDHFSR